jgi:DNA repair exonuclease SbcCD nuclease subunit
VSAPAPQVRLLHGSDLHIDNTPEGDRGLVQLIDAALELGVDLVLLVGDTFDDGRTTDATMETFIGHLDRLSVPVVLLPGNHDPYMDGSVYHRHELPGHVTVLDDPAGVSVELPHLAMEVWGRPHVSWYDSRPLQDLPPRGVQPWQVALAHGHLVRYPEDEHRSYLITSEEIAACERDYVALGHWDVQRDVSSGEVTAWYSGSPKRYASCALVTLSAHAGARSVHVEPIQLPG